MHGGNPKLNSQCYSNEKVSTYKYLGLQLSNNLYWNNHIQEVATKTRCLLGMLFRRYYQQCSSSVLRKLYLQPHLEYVSSIWHPHFKKHRMQLENVQKFALKICTKRWHISYSELLMYADIPSQAEKARPM